MESIILDFESKTRLNFTNFKNFNFIIRNSSLKTSKTLILLDFIILENFRLNKIFNSSPFNFVFLSINNLITLYYYYLF